MPKTYLKLFLLFLLILCQSADIKAQNEIAKKADSLFSANNYQEAAKLFESLLNDNLVNKENLFLKLAFIYEKQAVYPKALFYLNNYYNIQPQDEVFEKMNKIALENKYNGFEKNDLNFILMLYRNYYYYIIGVFIIIGLIIIYLIYTKKNANIRVTFRSKITIPLYLLFLLMLINAPNTFHAGIVNRSCALRSHASNAANIIGNLTEGDKVNIISQTDIWYKILWHRKLVFLNRKDIWVLK